LRTVLAFTFTRLWSRAALVGALLLVAHGAHARGPEPGVSGIVAIEEGYTDNLRADARSPVDAFFTDLRGEATWQRKPRGWLPHRLGALVHGRLYGQYTNRGFSEFGPSLGYDWDLVSLTVDYHYSPDRLRVDPATTADGFADGHDLPIEFRSKFGKNKRWTALLELDSQWEFYDPPFRERSFFEETVEAGLRCRATKLVAARASVAYAVRDAISENFDREEVSVLFGFDLFLPGQVRSIFRYEKTWRNFLVGSPADPLCAQNNNCGREDDVNHFQTGLDVPVPGIETATFHFQYDYRDNASSRRDRNYSVNEASLGLSYEFE